MLNIDDRLIKEVSPKIGPNALSVLLAIAIHLNQKTNRAFPSHNRLMELTGLGRDAVYTALKKLKDCGILTTSQTVDDINKRFGKRIFRVSTRFIKIFVDACDVEPFTEIPNTDESYADGPYTENPETKQLNNKEQINTKEQINKSERTPTPENDFSTLEAEKEKKIYTGPAPFSHSNKPTDLNTHFDLFDQMGEYYKANLNEWKFRVREVLPNRYTDEQLKSMLADYCAHAFADRNKYATFAAHHAKFCTWVKQQPQYERKAQPQYTPAKKSHRPEINENYAPKEKQLW